VTEGWTKKTLGELCEIELGKTPARANSTLWDKKRESGNVWLSIADLLNATNNVIADSKEYISDAGAATCKIVTKGTLLASFKLTLGRLAFAGCDLFTNEAIAALTIQNEKELSREFLFYHLTFLNWEKAAENDIKIKGLTLNKAKLKTILISFPSLAEQRRIVALLDEAFAALATAKTNAEQNLQNARALLESQLESVFSQRSEGWTETRLEEVCGLQNGFAFKSSTFKPSGTPILRISNIQNGRIDENKQLVFIDPRDYQENLDRYNVTKDDLLIAMSGATTGKLGFNTEETIYLLNQRVGKLEPGERLDKHFLYYYLSTKIEENLRMSAGSAQPNLSSEQIKNTVLPLPSVDEQMQIVNALEALRAETQHLTDLYERKLSALEELKTSLLHQAFNGEL
jgi:type I restriction enzyme S subunit